MSDSSTAQTQQRVIRVFVSSTFRDMLAERDELVKFVFPQLRRLCAQRGVTWGEVDLRWGVTNEQKAEGKVLPICLEEIRRCRPYFIGLLGERYGWIPEEIPQELIEQEPWLSEHRQHSVTELEILHGVLNDPEMARHAYFYFRDPAYLDTLSASEQEAYREEVSQEEIILYGANEAKRHAEDRRQKLVALKRRVRLSGLPVREHYADPRALGELVLHDLTAVIDQIFPEGTQPSPLDRDAADHDAFAQSRAGVYIGRQEYFDRLDAHVKSDVQPLVVLGESGSGKSALLANWALGYREKHPDELLLMHFIGATPDSADWMPMLRRVMGEFKRRFDLREDIPDEPDALRAAFANWLHMAAARGRVVLILDALNQLEDRDGAPDLVWLPPVIPANVRMIFSTLPGRALDEVTKRDWETLRIEPLTTNERKQLIREYLAQYTKALSSGQMEDVASTPQAANPLYLRTLLEELRVFGVHERLDERIKHYLDARTVDALYQRILARYEADYERESPGLVAAAMSLLWAARRGLSEVELLELLGSSGNPLPRAHWSPLYLALEQSLISRAGLIDFAHDFLRQAVQGKYLPSNETQRSTHLRLAGYFEGRALDPRKLDELPWQLAQAESWQKLYDLLADLPFFKAAWEANQFDVKAFWAQTENNSDLRIVSGYRKVLDRPSKYEEDYVWLINLLLRDTGHPDEALSLSEHLVQHYRQERDHNKLQASLGYQANILYARGDLDGAMALHKEGERLCRELGNKAGLSSSLGNQALILYARGDLDGAMALHKEEERLRRELGNKHGLQVSLGNQAVILKDRGDLDGAMALHKKEERLCRELGNKAGLSTSLGNQAILLHTRGDLDGAMALYKEEERLSHELGNKAGLRHALGNQAVILKDRGDLDGAMAVHKEEERLCRELGNKHGLQVSLGNQANILYARGDLSGAMALLKEQERLCRELGDKHGLQASLGNQAVILEARGELDGAMALYKEQELLCRELGNKDWLSTSLGNRANILYARGDLDGAMALYKEQERLCRELGDKAGLSTSLGNRANILYARGDLDGAMALYKEQEWLCRELGNKDRLSRTLGNQALILRYRGDLDGAMALHKEEERLCRELGNKAGLSRTLGNQALIFYDRGDLDGAMALRKEEERLCRELGNKVGLQISLGNQGLILQDRGDLDGAMALCKEQEWLCRELGDKAGLSTSLGSQARILYARDDLDGAMTLLKEEERLCRELGNKDGLSHTLGNQANILYDRGDLDGAMALRKEEERLCRELGDKQGLAISLVNQASTMVIQMDQPQKALALANEAYRLAAECGYASLANQIEGVRAYIRQQLAQ